MNTSGGHRAAAGVYTGTVPLFAWAGFVECRRTASGSRVVMRRPAPPGRSEAA